MATIWAPQSTGSSEIRPAVPAVSDLPARIITVMPIALHPRQFAA